MNSFHSYVLIVVNNIAPLLAGWSDAYVLFDCCETAIFQLYLNANTSICYLPLKLVANNFFFLFFSTKQRCINTT